MFSSIGWGEILIIVLIVVLLFGAAKLPQIGQSLGRSITGFRRGLKETTEDVKAAMKEDVTADTDMETKPDSTSTDTTKTGQS